MIPIEEVEQARLSDFDREVGLFHSQVARPVSPPVAPPAMRSHALVVLEFARALDIVAGFASSEAGAARVRILEPMTDAAAIIVEHARVEAARSLVSSEGGWTMEQIPDLAAALARLRVAGSSWTGLELRSAVTLLVSSRKTRDALLDTKRDEKEKAALLPLEIIAFALVSDLTTER